MVNITFVESVGAIPQRLENLTQLLSIFQRPQVAKLVEEFRNGNADAKRMLPAICWQASFNGQKRANKNAVPSGLFMLDIDHVSDIQQLYQEKIEPNLEAQQI